MNPDDCGTGERLGWAGFHVPAQSAALSRLAAVTAKLAAADTMGSVVAVVVSHVVDAVHAAVSTLILRDGDQLRIVGQHGVAAEKAERWTSFPVSDVNPASEAVRTGSPVVAATAAEVRARYPRMAADTPEQRSVICLPLKAVGEVIGVIGLTFEENWNPGRAELKFLMTFADTCAQSIRRVRAMEEASHSASRLKFLAQASAELSSSLDYRVTLSNVTRLAVPTLADWCAVDLLVDEQLVTLAVAHVDPAKTAWAWELRQRYPVQMDATTGAPNVVRTGVSELYAELTDEMLVAAAQDEQHLRLTRELELHSVMIVPLIARGRALGTITLIRAETEQRFTDADLSLAQDLGARAGVAIDNARLYDKTANVALQLQRAVLPDHLDELDGWETASHYSPDGRVLVGGDFFDAVGLPDGRLAVFIGDVMGHGIQAAATMAQIRAAVRAFLTIDPEPTIVMSTLDEMFRQLAVRSLVTLVYAIISPNGDVEFVNAGHHPPLIVTSDGSRFVGSRVRTPLGIRAARTPVPTAQPTASTRLQLRPGCTLLLYTDGLTERRGEDLDIGLARLIHHSAVLHTAPLDLGLAELVEQMAGEEPHDDVAAIAVRRGLNGASNSPRRASGSDGSRKT